MRTAFAGTTARVAGWLARAATRPGDRVPLPGAQAGLAEMTGTESHEKLRLLSVVGDRPPHL